MTPQSKATSSGGVWSPLYAPYPHPTHTHPIKTTAKGQKVVCRLDEQLHKQQSLERNTGVLAQPQKNNTLVIKMQWINKTLVILSRSPCPAKLWVLFSSDPVPVFTVLGLNLKAERGKVLCLKPDGLFRGKQRLSSLAPSNSASSDPVLISYPILAIFGNPFFCIAMLNKNLSICTLSPTENKGLSKT